MNCYVCDDRGQAVSAVAICQNCGVGLCRDHLDRDLLAIRPQGVTRRQCTHDPIHGAHQRERARARPPSPRV